LIIFQNRLTTLVFRVTFNTTKKKLRRIIFVKKWWSRWSFKFQFTCDYVSQQIQFYLNGFFYRCLVKYLVILLLNYFLNYMNWIKLRASLLSTIWFIVSKLFYQPCYNECLFSYFFYWYQVSYSRFSFKKKTRIKTEMSPWSDKLLSKISLVLGERIYIMFTVSFHFNR